MRRALLCLCALGLSLSTLALAQAHAGFQRGDPWPNARLERAPAQVQIRFSDTLNPSVSRLSVLNGKDQRVDNNDSQVDPADPRLIRVSLPGSLPVDRYTVAWSVLSAEDGHANRGRYQFATGDAPLDPATPLPTGSGFNSLGLPELLDALARWVGFLAITLLAGTCLAGPWALRPALAELPNAPAALGPRYGRWTVGLVAAAVLAELFSIGTRFVALRGSGDLPALGAGDLLTLLSGVFGIATLARLLLLLALGLVCWRAAHQGEALTRVNELALEIGWLVLLTQALTGHAATNPGPLRLYVVVDWLHLTGTTLWLGGILFLGLRVLPQIGRLPADEQALFVMRLTQRFSVLALAGFGLLLLTGLANTALRLAAPAQLFSYAYGNILLIKHLLFVALILTAAAIRWALRGPRLALANGGAVGSGTIAVARVLLLWRLDLMLAATILFLAALLGSFPPPITLGG